MAQLKLNQVSKRFGTDTVINDVNLDVESGEFIVFVGPSGCGKSTLLRMIAGLERISDGTLQIDGAVVNDVPPAERGVAMVFQSYALYPHLTVRENMAFALKIARQSKDEIERAISKAAEVLALTPYLDRLPKSLSGGQRQRVAIGRAIVRNPKVFLFDEPLSNLDTALRVATRVEIAELKQKMPSTTMVYVTHDQVEAMTLATRIVVINKGRIEQVGPPLELYQHPANEFVAQFIGSPAMNLFEANIVETGESTELTLTDEGRARSSVSTPDNLRGSRLSVGVRPEDLKTVEGDNYLYRGRVAFAEILGEVTLLHIRREGDSDVVIAKLPGIHRSMLDQPVKLTADPDRIHLFKDGRSLYSA